MNNFFLTEAHIHRFYYMPDEPGSGGSDLPNEEGSNNAGDEDDSPNRYLPRDQDNLTYLADALADWWVENDQIALVYETAAHFKTKTTAALALLQTRRQAGGNRPGVTLTLETLDEKAKEGVAKIKTYLLYKHRNATNSDALATADLARYAIVKEGTTYQLPRDRQSRLLALPQLLAALIADGFSGEAYGEDWWTAYQTDLQAALHQASGIDGQVSDEAAGLQSALAHLRRVLISLRFVLRGNYPDDYRSKWRAAGFQAEDY